MTDKTYIETRISRPGSSTKYESRLADNHLIVDFDEFGKDMPDTQLWRETLHNWQLSPNQSISIFEAGGTFCSARLAWMLSCSGFHEVQLVPEPSSIDDSYDRFDATMLDKVFSQGFVGKTQVLDAIDSEVQIIDVRGVKRFSGDEADPRPGVRAGHIPNSINIPYKLFLSDKDAEVFKSPQVLNQLFKDYEIDLDKTIIFSCGSGITACIGAWAARIVGATQVSVYDGSWVDWGSDSSLPLSTGVN